MLVRKLRLQRGWSQDQLAELTGLSVRTIQRVERGQRPSLETAKALASVFEVDLSTFTPEIIDMRDETELQPDEEAALKYAKRVREFLEGVAAFVVMIVVFFAVFGFDQPVLYWVFAGVGAALAVQGLLAFELIRLPTVGIEKRLAEKRLGRKL
jgi:transcriptional regulator with XRE-family HTH domain